MANGRIGAGFERRMLLRGTTAALGASFVLPGKAPAQAGTGPCKVSR